MITRVVRGTRRRARRLLFGSTTAREQLEMLWPEGARAPVPAAPEGYVLRTYRDADRGVYLRLMRHIFEGQPPLEYLLERVLPDGFFVAIDDSTAEIAATCMALHHPTRRHPFGGNLGWLATDPGHAGRGLGTAVAAAVTRRLVQGGYRRIFLETDDDRLPAMSVYLKLGWVPYLFAADMPGRWRAVFDELGRDFTPEAWPGEPALSAR